MMEPRCFMHVPKSAGASIRVSLEHALPPEAVGPKRQDATLLCGFTDLDRLEPGIRALLAVDPDEISALANHPVVSGHFSLPTLLRVAAPSSVATALREPRSRLLSHFAYWRLSTGLRSTWRGYPPLEHALRSLDEFLAEPQIAQATDNLLCRMLLFGDPRIPELDFITDPEAIALQAIAALKTLGFVGIVELPEAMWRGLSTFFDTHLSPMVINTTAAESVGSSAPALELDVTADTLDLISARTAADTIVYQHVQREAGLSSSLAERLGAAAFANELMRLGNIAGTAATESRERACRIEELSEQLDVESRQHTEVLTQVQQEVQDTREELSRNRASLAALQKSKSWRITAPARAARRAFKQRWAHRGRVDPPSR